MEIQLLLLHISLLTLCSLSCSAILGVASSPSLAKPNCTSHCGSIEIPYPFGIEPGCYRDNNRYDRGFQILCNTSTDPPKPFLNLSDTSRPEVLNISLGSTVIINSPIFFSDCPNKPNYRQSPNLLPDIEVTPFTLSEKNKFTSVSCGMIASLRSPESDEGQVMAVCLSICRSDRDVLVNNTCGGINCCQASLPSAAYRSLDTSFEPLRNGNGSERSCKYAFLVDPDWFTSNSTNTSVIAEMEYVPILLDWKIYDVDESGLLIGSGGVDNSTEDNKNRNCESENGPCSCAKGYEGNPYLRGGCQVLCSVFGLVFVITGAWYLHKVMKKRKNKKRKQKFYTQNGGLLLEKLLSSGEVNVEKIKLFDAKELEKATCRFNADRILGEGGQGTVYKGMLTDGRIVAVKKSKIVEGGEVSQFINEIVILSQINHRNVVKLLGCCLESEVPLLVYEFLPNGTLSQYIHSRDEDFPLTWEMRLRVGVEVAGALSYLHSSASMPIYHRDIKSSNILLDEKHRAKVADFGTSRSVSIDQTHLTMTHVNGTFGYLDPEYFQSSQFTDKSDVYSFGVVLAELLTGKKPVSVARSQEGRQDGTSLATHFIVSMEENSLFDILDDEVMKGAKKEEILAVASLAKRCLNMKGKKRPTMKEIAVELEGILTSSNKSSDVEQITEVECPQTEIVEAWDVVSTSTGSHLDTGSSLDVQPLMSFKSF
uniref:wall-associated receptor kinase-like 1 n=1 Tax=Fragaria vesca subsp. vesca TaxID=101020 RepID=UPI0005CA31A0|nr:PREDICTED: wall-associated receptor kinase-like 1 [Fragaria vesca subsp. vesca]